MKVLHLPTTIAGNAWGLAQAEKKIGLDSVVLTREERLWKYPHDISLQWEKKNNLGKALASIRAFFKYRKKFDVFHFNMGATLIDFPIYKSNNIGVYLWDLPFYPKGKKLIFTYNGCDAREKYKTIKRVKFSPCHDDNCHEGICNNGIRDKVRSSKIKKVGKYADRIFALNPDLMWFLPEDKTTFLPYTISYWDNIKYKDISIDNKIYILHAPSFRVTKGSKYILKALRKLEKKYKNVEIIIVEKMPYKKALNLYKKATIVVDQVLIGWYGGFAVEVMKMGKPVAVFIREEDLRFIPPKMAKDVKDTFINISPFNIERKLEKYIQNSVFIKRKSKASLDFVHKWHDPVKIAKIVKEYYLV